jgi:hypothetical protein
VLASAWRQSMVGVPGLLAHAQMCVLGHRDDDRV